MKFGGEDHGELWTLPIFSVVCDLALRMKAQVWGVLTSVGHCLNWSNLG